MKPTQSIQNTRSTLSGVFVLTLMSVAGAGAQTNTKTGASAGANFASGANNTANGFSALMSDTSGNGNTAVGSSALKSNVTGHYNTAVGLSALMNNTNHSNSAFGSGALARNTKGGSSAAFGANALNNNTAGSFNVAVGRDALLLNTKGASNVAVGLQALSKNIIGNLNTAVGDGALISNTGDQNIALGEDAGTKLTTGSHNIVIGNFGVAGESGKIRIGTAAVHSDTYLAGIIHGNGSGLTGVRTSASNIYGQIGNPQIKNAAIGSGKLRPDLTLGGVTSGNFSGDGSGLSNLNGGNLGAGSVGADKLGADVGFWSVNEFGDFFHSSSWVGIGTAYPDAPMTVSTPTNDYGITHTDGTVEFSTYVDAKGAWLGTTSNHPLSFYTNNGSQQMVLLQNGNFGIGTNMPTTTLDVVGEVTCTAINLTSDRNAKMLFKPVNSRLVLDKVIGLPITEWQYKTREDARHIGPMAQDFHAAFALGRDEKHITSVDADGVALAAIQGLNEKIEEQLKDKDAQIDSLKSANRELAERLDAIEKALRQDTKGGNFPN